jgi:BirA family transcriptional regulator, biotin operon repressor / biotin---[acetyl-CoA-carboxylase] ligase
MSPRDFRTLSTRHIGRTILVYDSVTSTNDIALSQPLGTVVMAHEQTAGRGQFGRTWQAPPGTAIQLSATIDPPVELRRPVMLTAWAAVAVAETVLQVTDVHPQIKWPNDVLLQDRKVGGILIEQKSITVVGIGLNVNQSGAQFVAAGLVDAGSLANICGGQFDRDTVAQRLILNLDAQYDCLLGGRSSLEGRWVELIGLVGKQVTAEKRDGTLVNGLLLELSFDRILLENDAETISELAPEAVRHLRRKG